MSDQRRKLKDLIGLMIENPDLPVIPCVDCEVVGGDEYSNWFGSWGYAYTDEYAIGSDEERWRFKSDYCTDRVDWELFEDFFDIDEIPQEMPDEEAEKIYWKKVETIPWKKAIFVYIGLPEEAV